MAARYGHLINKWTVAVMAVMAVMAALLAAALPVSAQTITIEKLVPYVENGEQPVDTFDATGLDARKVFWYLEGTDAGRFKLGSFTGRTTTLLFRSPPNFEGPMDRADTGDTDNACADTPGTGECDNAYKVTVRAGDGGADKSKVFMVTVEVQNAKELGKIKLTPTQPQVTRQMTADLSDPDRVRHDALNFRWTSSATLTGSYTPIPGAANQNTYTPRTSDVGRFIRVKATYRDGAIRNEDTAMAEATSDYAVEAQPFPNVAPVFADQNPGNGTTGTDNDLLTTRTVDEELPGGALVGPPVTAVDHDGDVLTYSLFDGDADLGDGVQDADMDGDSTNFEIDPKTGQITTKMKLEADGDSPTCTGNACTVTVTATDPSGLATAAPQASAGATQTDNTNVMVTINVSPVNESPGSIADTTTTFDDPAPTNTFRYQDRAEGLATDVTLATYTATDLDGLGDVTYRLAGPDGSAFSITGAGALTFGSSPDYDGPADENEDNVYELLVVASDPQLNVSTLWVTIKVTDEPETGEVSFNQRHPAVGEAITAELEDRDGIDGAVSWQWHNVGTSDEDVTDFSATSATAIAGATSATYTPVVDDVGDYLKAVATYNDNQALGEEQRAGATDATIANTSNATTLMVLAIPTTNVDPAFDPDHTATRRYYVAENETALQNTAAATAVGATADPAPVVVATDEDTPVQTLTYSLAGADAGYFKIGGSLDDPDTAAGTLSSKGLDFEDPDRGSYPARVTYNIMVRATDPFGSTAQVPVTVIVTDKAEDPKIGDPPSGDPVSVMVNDEEVTAPMAVVFDENGTGTVADFSATDPDGDSIAWAIVPATEPSVAVIEPTADATSVDNALFEINSLTGVLTFKSPPNYEDEKDGTDATTAGDNRKDNIYQVTVRARSLDAGSDNTESDTNDTYALKVKVLNVSENPVFRISSSSRSREEDHGLEAAVTRGPDRPIGNVPVTATDPDNTDAAASTLTYTLEGSDAASFSIVPATGQLLTKDMLDYETKSEYSVVVKASDDSEMDPAKRDDTIDIGIDVLDVLEIVPAPLTVEGQAAVSYTENDTGDVAEYTAVGDSADNVTWNPIKGDDAAYFMLEGPTPGSNSVMLKFRQSPNYEMPRGMAMSDTNTNTYNLSVEILHTTTNTTASLPVQVTVADAEELGALSGMSSVSYVENDTVAVDTYTVDGPMAADAMWSLEGDDMTQFTLDAETGASVMLMFANPPNFEMPRGMAISGSNTNTYMVTVKAMVGGEMAMQDVAVMITDTDDMGTLAITPTTQPEAGMELTATLSDDDGGVIDVTWQWSKSMTMDGTYENISGATSMTYTPVDADGGYYLRATAMYTDAYGSGKEAMDTTTSMVIAILDQMGSVRLSSMTPVVDAALTATLSDPDGGVTGPTWQWSMTMTMDGTFMDIAGATSMSYTPMAADEGYYLRATVMYTDAHGSGKDVMATTTTAVTTGDPLVNRYDANGNGTIEKREVIEAINDYLFGTGGGTPAPSKAEVIRLINLYLFG